NVIAEGNAADSLKHIGYKESFAEKINEYLNGEARTIVNIKLPIKKDLKLEEIYIDVLSDIKNLNNDYINDDSDLIVKTTKSFSDNNFITDINLTNSKISLGRFGIFKEKAVSGKI